MRSVVSVVLMAAVILACCGCSAESAPYSITYLDVFDTVTTVMGRADSQEQFQAQASQIHESLQRYHRLFDIYNTYDGLNNLKTVNDNAGIAPVTVDSEILALLNDCKSYYTLTGGKVNAAMGSVLSLWHDARQMDEPQPPSSQALDEAMQHCSWDTVILDEENSTVYLTDPAQRLDVGAIAKGWAVQQIAQALPQGYLLSVGGNVCATGAKTERGTPWTVGVNSPDGGEYLTKLKITDGAVVTSGDYQRYFVYDGARYHHIIDPQTGMPSSLWRAVTVVCADSALADALSTALFLLPQEEGEALLAQTGAEALWVAPDGTVTTTPGFTAYTQ